VIRLGTRASTLALTQSRTVADAITALSGEAVELVKIVTHGDISTAPLESLGGVGVFASALREALKNGECDLVVHSLKDLPTAGEPGLVIAAIPERADSRDVLCARDDLTLAALPEGAVVGTGSPRRRAQLRHRRPDLDIRGLRGNIDTRLSHVAEGRFDAIVLAAAGLSRVGRLDAVTEYFELDAWPTAPGQGALAVEVRDEPASLSAVGSVLATALAALDHLDTRVAVEAERHLLARLEAGCAAPVAAHAFIDAGLLFLTGEAYSPDTGETLTVSHALELTGTAEQLRLAATEIAERAAVELLENGAAELAGLGSSL
jgi:hydroxymethylbilane synthase